MDFGKTGRHGCRRPRRAFTAWVLIVGFLLQPVLAYLVTPIVVHAEGQQVVVCTLKGSKLVMIDLPHLADNDRTEHCSALKLYQMAGTSQISDPSISTSASLYAVELLEQTADLQHRSLHFSAYSTRAPPFLS